MEKSNQNNPNAIAGAILIVGVLIAGAILLRGTNAPTENIPAGKESTAKKIGLNVKSFNTCLASGKFKDKIQADIDDGIKAGVSGTPSSFVLKDGKLVSFISEDGRVSNTIPGAQPYNIIMKNIERILANDTETIETQIRPVSSNDHIIGSANAKIIIIEFSDLECPFCKVFHNTMRQVIEGSNGDVAWVYRHYPIPQLHSKAFREAEATECAWEQGGNDGFWKYINRIFEITPSNNGLEESEL